MVHKLSHVLDDETLRSVFYATFEFHLYYVSLVWAQNTNLVDRLHLL